VVARDRVGSLSSVSDPPTILHRFATFEELNEFLAVAAPTREDDSPVLVGETGRRATPEELAALVEAVRSLTGE